MSVFDRILSSKHSFVLLRERGTFQCDSANNWQLQYIVENVEETNKERVRIISLRKALQKHYKAFTHRYIMRFVHVRVEGSHPITSPFASIRRVDRTRRVHALANDYRVDRHLRPTSLVCQDIAFDTHLCNHLFRRRSRSCHTLAPIMIIAADNEHFSAFND